MKLYMIRHGQTDWNRIHRLQGRTDIPLNKWGRQVAELTREGLKEIPFDLAFTSPLSRARETAELVLEGREIPIFNDDRLLEVNFGKYEGESFSVDDENMQNFFHKPEDYYSAGGSESIESVIERTGDFLNELYQKKEYQNSTILVSTHGAAICGLLCNIKKWEKANFWKGGLHKNCGFSIVEVTDGEPTIIEEAIVAYDEEEVKEKCI